jgi:peptide/nickel transport system ATP-binding protein
MGVVAEMADNVAVMYAGQVVEYGSVQGIFENPKHPYTQGLLASMPMLGEERDELTVIPGTVPSLVKPPTGCRFANRCPYRFERCDDAPPLIPLAGGRQARCWLHEKGEVTLDPEKWRA